MKQAIVAFLKRPTTIVGIITAITFQLIFSVIWMTGYDGVTDRVSKLHVGIVNADGDAGNMLSERLKQAVPFQTELYKDAAAAQQALNDRDLQMVIAIPQGFMEGLQTPNGQGALQFTINESNPAMIKSIMQSAADRLSSEVNKQAVAGGAEALLTSQNMSADQAKAVAASLAEKVKADIASTNKIDGMNNQMVPMMLVLASYVGAMIMGMNIEQSSMMLSGQFSKWQRMAVRFFINAVSAVVVSGVGVGLLAALGGQAEHGFLLLWAFQALTVVTFMFVAQMFLFLFGMAGMLFNILSLSIQLVSSGAMIPRELLPNFYVHVGDALPATYAVQGMMNILFGGPTAAHAAGMLAVIAIAAMALSAAAVGLRKGKPLKAAAPAQVVSVANKS
ncbi:YhgE/Pip domain-containing protein [Paenibacillus sp. MMS18-CY102]|uniref:YhgE/Pip domain-containing protein n=1 Tax=Paenibacillus sp. MMS18-CY102 TaxID=2682849 RepID=UPI001365C3D5|nr:ABC transporter permease [Paenibacillus sp. MMS18-CY102]MWC30673.1 ABC transporter permease [Paenibacillus sp. MMS18-CY102]